MRRRLPCLAKNDTSSSTKKTSSNWKSFLLNAGLTSVQLLGPTAKDDYLIESRRAVSLLIVELESLFIVEDESLFIIEVESVTDADVSVVSVFVLEQAVAKAIIAKTKNADFAMGYNEFELIGEFQSVNSLKSKK